MSENKRLNNYDELHLEQSGERSLLCRLRTAAIAQ